MTTKFSLVVAKDHSIAQQFTKMGCAPSVEAMAGDAHELLACGACIYAAGYYCSGGNKGIKGIAPVYGGEGFEGGDGGGGDGGDGGCGGD